MKTDLITQLKAMRRVSTPLVAVTSPDIIATEAKVRATFENGGKTPIPLVRWDAMDGLRGVNRVGHEALVAALGGKTDEWPAMTTNPGAALAVVAGLPGERLEDGKVVQRGSIVFVHNAQRYLEDVPGRNIGQNIQGIQNLRDAYKADRRMLVLLVNDITLPPELAQDVVVVEDPYPTDEELRVVVDAQMAAAGLKPLKPIEAEGAVDALRGLSAYAAEQTFAMSLTERGIDADLLWARAIAVVEQSDGLEVDDGPESFDDVRGLQNVREFSELLIRSKRAPTLYLRIDEIEKYLGGLGQGGGPADNTGTTQDKLGVMLRTMEDEGWTGLIGVGHAGTGKTLLSKALANAATRASGRRVLSVALDLGATDQKEVGESGKKIRRALAIVNSLARGGRVCVVAVCNDMSVIPPALKRRFKLGQWMFDLPDRPGREAMWKMYLDKYEVADRDLPDDEDWTGADIRNVCDTASSLGITLKKACQFTTIVAKSDPEAVVRLRRLADGKLISADRPGIYEAPRVGFASLPYPGGRVIGKEE